MNMNITSACETEPLLHPRTEEEKNDTHKSSAISDATKIRISRYRMLALLFVTVTIAIFMSRLGSMVFFDTTRIFDQDSLEGYEYIIVGAGPAGIIVAMNLAEKLLSEAMDRRCSPGKVLLIESGTRSQSAVEEKIREMNGATINRSLSLNEFDIPLAWSMLSKLRNSLSDRKTYRSHQWESDTINFLGKAVGGSGIHNAMINVRALPTDFDRWNVSNWSAEDVMPYFNHLETYISNPTPSFFPTKNDSNGTRGNLGPLTTGTLGTLLSPLARDFILSAVSSDFPLASNGFNEADPFRRIGVGFYEFNIRGGIRDSVAEAYFRTNLPYNLVLLTGATVRKALFNERTDGLLPKAVGVEYILNDNGTPRIAMLTSDSRSESEVIFSAGAILSPQLLANSGIHQDGEIAVSPDVGKNVQDHPAIAVSFEMTNSSTDEVLNYFFNGEKSDSFENLVRSRLNDWVPYIDSPLSTPGFSSGGFLRSPYSKRSEPDVQITVFPHIEEPHFSLTKHGTNISRSRQWTFMMITVALLQPESKNNLILNQSEGGPDYFSVPELNLGELTDDDVKKIVWGIEQVRKIMSSPPVALRILHEAVPGKLVTGDNLYAYVRENIMQNSHWSGSTRMGMDSKSVVDENLKVRGVRNLRVIDAGIMPIIPNGNTHSTTCALALRGADLIR